MPVREIPRNYRSVTGSIASAKSGRQIAFESTLERDFFTRQEFDPGVAWYEEQPLHIKFVHNMSLHIYTPDALVVYIDGSAKLFEIKYRNKLRSTWNDHRYQYKAAAKHAKLLGMRFTFATEVEIRTSQLDLAGYLLPYRRRIPDQGIWETTRAFLLAHGTTTFSNLARHLFLHHDRDAVLTTLYNKISVFHVLLGSYEEPLCSESMLSLSEST